MDTESRLLGLFQSVLNKDDGSSKVRLRFENSMILQCPSAVGCRDSGMGWGPRGEGGGEEDRRMGKGGDWRKPDKWRQLGPERSGLRRNEAAVLLPPIRDGRTERTERWDGLHGTAYGATRWLGQDWRGI